MATKLKKYYFSKETSLTSGLSRRKIGFKLIGDLGRRKITRSSKKQNWEI
jgi:hypothetical protein